MSRVNRVVLDRIFADHAGIMTALARWELAGECAYCGGAPVDPETGMCVTCLDDCLDRFRGELLGMLAARG